MRGRVEPSHRSLAAPAARADARAADLAPIIAELRAAGITSLAGIDLGIEHGRILEALFSGWLRGSRYLPQLHRACRRDLVKIESHAPASSTK